MSEAANRELHSRNPAGDRGSSSSPWPDLVVALLSVNNHPIDRTFRYFEGLQRERLFDPQTLADLTEEELARRLSQAGYNRGPVMTAIFTTRLHALGEFIVSRGLEHCSVVLNTGDRRTISEFLAMAHGVGPTVLKNFFLLRGI